MTGEVEPQPDRRVGALLRRCRLQAGLDLAEASLSLHIRRRFLEAIEVNRFEALPGPVYAIGFVRAYAAYLGLDADEVARRFRNEIAGLGAATPLHFPLPLAEGGTPKAAVVLLGAIIAIGAYATWYATSERNFEVAQTAAPVPERLESMLNGETRRAGPAHEKPVEQHPAAVSPVPVAAGGKQPSDGSGKPAGAGEHAAVVPPAGAPTPVTSGPVPPSLPGPIPGPAVNASAESIELAGAAAAVPPAVPAAPVAAPVAAPGPSVGAMAMAAEPPHPAGIELHARADSWVEVRQSEPNTLVMARLLRAGEVYRVPERSGLTLVTGNAGGLVVMVDGQAAPPLGKDGAVRRGIPLDADAWRKGMAEAGAAQ